MSKIARKILLVGGGLTSAFTACLLRNSNLNATIYVFEKSTDVGGRMKTFRHPNDSSLKADLGAQFITASPGYIRDHAQFYEMLLEAKLLKPLAPEDIKDMRKGEPGTLYFVAPQGTGAIVRYLWNLSGSIIYLDTEVKEIQLSGNQWFVTDTSLCQEIFDSVVLTMPVPEMFELQGTVHDLLQKKKDELNEITYSNNYALGLFYIGGSFPTSSSSHTASFIHSDPISYISFEHLKQGKKVQLGEGSEGGSKEVAVVVVHSSSNFFPKRPGQTSEENLRSAEENLLSCFSRLFPNFPPPDKTLFHQWKYSRVESPHRNARGCLVLHSDPLLLCGGDAFSHSSFDGCLDSAIRVTEFILASLSPTAAQHAATPIQQRNT